MVDGEGVRTIADFGFNGERQAALLTAAQRAPFLHGEVAEARPERAERVEGTQKGERGESDCGFRIADCGLNGERQRHAARSPSPLPSPIKRNVPPGGEGTLLRQGYGGQAARHAGKKRERRPSGTPLVRILLSPRPCRPRLNVRAYYRRFRPRRRPKPPRPSSASVAGSGVRVRSSHLPPIQSLQIVTVVIVGLVV